MPNHMKMHHEVDPRDELMSKANVSGIDVFGNKLLVAVYMRPEKLASGLFMADNTRAEDKFQGKIGLVIKMGPDCFVDTDNYRFNGMRAEIGDWIAFNVSQGTWSLTIDGTLYRLVDDIHVRLIVDEPDRIF